MGHQCGCGHHCHDDVQEEPSDDAIALAGKKVESLKKAIQDLGYKVDETPDGEIKITE